MFPIFVSDIEISETSKSLYTLTLQVLAHDDKSPLKGCGDVTHFKYGVPNHTCEKAKARVVKFCTPVGYIKCQTKSDKLPSEKDVVKALTDVLKAKLQFFETGKSYYDTTTTSQPFYGPFSGTTRVSRCQKRTSGLYGARED